MAARTEERQYKPYRRFLVVVFALLVCGLCGMIIRGITRTLDRLPQAEHMATSAPLDARALKACAEDLRRLESKVRTTAGRRFTVVNGPKFGAEANALELERLKLVGRCGLQNPQGDAAREALARAAEGIETLLRVYALLDSRFADEGYTASSNVKEALQQADRLLAP